MIAKWVPQCMGTVVRVYTCITTHTPHSHVTLTACAVQVTGHSLAQHMTHCTVLSSVQHTTHHSGTSSGMTMAQQVLELGTRYKLTWDFKMIVLGDFRVRKNDKLNWCVEKKHILSRGKNTGQESWKVIGFYTSLATGATALLDKIVDESDHETIGELITTIKDAKKAIVSAVSSS
jgi:hypothetical protein